MKVQIDIDKLVEWSWSELNHIQLFKKKTKSFF